MDDNKTPKENLKETEEILKIIAKDLGLDWKSIYLKNEQQDVNSKSTVSEHKLNRSGQ